MNENTHKGPDAFKITGDWAAQSKSLKSRFNLLTDSDLHLEAGKDLEVLNRVQERLSKSREDAIRIIRSASRENSATPGDGKL